MSPVSHSQRTFRKVNNKTVNLEHSIFKHCTCLKMLKEIFFITLVVIVFSTLLVDCKTVRFRRSDQSVVGQPGNSFTNRDPGTNRENRASKLFRGDWIRKRRQVYADPLLTANPISIDDPMIMVDPLATMDIQSPYYGLLSTENVGQILPFAFYDMEDAGWIQPMPFTDLILPDNLMPYAVTPNFLAMYPPLYTTFQLLCDDLTLRCFYYY